MRTGLTKREKTTDIWFDEKDPLIHIRTHNTDLKKRLAAYSGQHPDQCRQQSAYGGACHTPTIHFSSDADCHVQLVLRQC